MENKERTQQLLPQQQRSITTDLTDTENTGDRRHTDDEKLENSHEAHIPLEKATHLN